MEVKIICQGAESLPIEDLTQFQDDIKKLSNENYEKLKAQIMEIGYAEPINIWECKEENKKYIGNGHQRLVTMLRMKSEGFTIPNVPVSKIFPKDKSEFAKIVLSLTSQYGEIDAKGTHEYLIKHNIPVQYIEEKLRLPELNLPKFKNEFYPSESSEDDDAVPEVNEPFVKPGELWTLGNHRLLCGDSTDKAQVERLMNGEKADMVFTSPPYNGDTHLDYGNGQNKKLYENELDSKSSEEYIQFCHDSLNNCFRFSQGFIFWNVNYNAKSRFEFIKGIYPFVEKLWESIAWKKTAMPISSGLTRNFEFIFVFKNGDVGHLGNLNETQFSVWDVSNIGANDKENHRACFPVALPEKAINLTKSNTVLDLFLGSGSTLIACEKTNRRCFGMEIDPHYCSVIIERWQKFTGLKAVLESA